MTATLLVHAAHHGGADGLFGVALLLIGAGAALWRVRRRDR